MNHARLLMVSAIASALAACGGGGGGDSTSNATSTSAASSSSSAAANVAVNVDGLTLPAARHTVEESNEEAAKALQALMELMALLAQDVEEADAARLQAEQAAAQAAAANAQNKAAAEQAAREAAARHEALQKELAATQARVKQAEEELKVQSQKLTEAQAKLAGVIRRDAPAAATPATDILDCSRNASVVTDTQTGLQLVCESQITTGTTTAEVGSTKHASGRYYALPFPDKTMIHAANQVAYKMACGQKICEWSKMGGSMDIVYAAQGKDGKYYRFTACRKGDADRVICAYPRTGVPDGVDAWFDDREPEMPRIGAAITGTSGASGFSADAEVSAPLGCWKHIPQDYVFPWPGKERFQGRTAGFDGGNCLGQVIVSIYNQDGTPDAPGALTYRSSAGTWPLSRVAGPDGKLLEYHGYPFRQSVTSAEEAAQWTAAWREDRTRFYRPGYFRQVTQATPADAANGASTATDGAGTATPANPATTAPAATPPTSPATDSSGTTGTTTGTSGSQTTTGTGAAGTAAGTTPATGDAASAQPDARNTGGDAATGTTQTPPTSAGMFQQQRNDGAADPGTRSESDGAFPWSGNGSTATYGGRQVTTIVQPNGDIIYRTSSGEVPFDRALNENGNVLRAVAGSCRDVDGGAQECTFRAAA